MNRCVNEYVPPMMQFKNAARVPPIRLGTYAGVVRRGWQEANMNITWLLVGIAIVAGVCGMVTGIAICDSLRRRGEKVSFIWLRMMMPAYVHRYSRITREETGKTGPLFYHFVIAMNVSLVAAVAAAVIAV